MKIGFENEYFVADVADGKFLANVPHDLPHDAAGTLVEARSAAYDDPFATLKSFDEKLKDLEQAVVKRGYTLCCLDVCDKVASIYGGPETAGFHIHFSDDGWNRASWPTSHHTSAFQHQHDNPPKTIAAMIEQLDAEFKEFYTGIKRCKHNWRPKTWGWEYRRLPATVDPHVVATRLAGLYYPQALSAPKKKVA